MPELNLGGLLRDGETVGLSPGRYRIGSRAAAGSLSNFTLRGTGSGPRDVVIEAPEGWTGDWLVVGGGSGCTFENFTVDIRSDWTTSASMVLKQSDGLTVRDIDIVGNDAPDDSYGSKTLLRPRITSTSGSGLVDGFRWIEGSGVWKSYPDRNNPIHVGPGHSGELVFRNLDIRESGSHSIYGTRHNGCIRVENSYFENNDNTNIRVSGSAHPTKDNWVRNCTILLDPSRVQYARGSYDGARGIKMDSHESVGGYKGGRITWDNIDIVMRGSLGGTRDAIKVESNHGGGLFRNIRVLNESSNNFVQIESDVTGMSPQVSFEDCHFVGSGRLRSGRSASLTNCCVDSQASISGFSVDGLSRSNCVVASAEPPSGGTGGDSGGGGGGGVTTTGIAITNDGSGRTDYQFVTDGEIVSTSGFGTGDSVSSDLTTATGFVQGGTDEFEYTGSITGFSYDGVTPTVYRAGSEIRDLSNVVESTSGGGGGSGGSGSGGEVIPESLALAALGYFAVREFLER